MKYLIDEQTKTMDFIFVELLAVEREPPHTPDSKAFFIAYGLMGDGKVARSIVEYTFYGTGFWVGDWMEAKEENILMDTLMNQECWRWAHEEVGCQDNRDMNHKFMWDLISWFINEEEHYEPDIRKPTEEAVRASASTC